MSDREQSQSKGRDKEQEDEQDQPARRSRVRQTWRHSTTFSTRSTRCSRRTPRSSSRTTCKRAGSDRSAPGAIAHRRPRPRSQFHRPTRFAWAPSPPMARLEGEGALSVPEGDDGARPPLRRRSGYGRRSASHRGPSGGAPPDPQGVSRRPLLGSRDRRHRRARHRDGQAVPGRARALREDRRGAALLGGKGLLPGPPGPQPAAPRLPGPGGRPSVRRLRREGARGRLYSYDVVGGRYEETDFGSTGSGAGSPSPISGPPIARI